MKKLHWWHSELTERQRINEAAEMLTSIQSAQGDTSLQLGRLFELDRDQGREIARLQTVMMTLVEMLIDSGTFTEEQISAKMSGALDALDREEQADRAAPRDEKNPFNVPGTPADS